MTSDSEPARKNKPTPYRAGKAPKKGDTAKPEMPLTAASVQPDSQKPPHDCEITCKTEKTKWDRIKPFVEVTGVLLLFVYTLYTIKMYCANQKSANAAHSAADTAARQLELTERPWVDANITLDGPFDFNQNGANIHLKLLLRNTGPSPAESTSISYLGLIGNKTANAENYRDQVCKDATRFTTSMPFGITLFPNVSFDQRESVGIENDAIKSGKDSIEFPNTHLPDDIFDYPTVIVCIAYRPTFNKTSIYHTAYILDLLHLKPFNGYGGVTFKIGEDVPVEDLLLRIHTTNAVYAD
jgi:hypothetical protein